MSTLRPEEGFHLDNEEGSQVSKLLKEHKNVFERSVEETPFAKHTINVASPSYRLSHSTKAALQEQLDLMLTGGGHRKM